MTENPRPERPPTSGPAAKGVDARGVLAFLDAVGSRRNVEPHSVPVLRHGVQVVAGHWWPYRPDRPNLLYSLSKSFTATAAGFAVAEGRLDPDDLVVDHFPEFADVATHPRTRATRVRHLLAMASGHLQDMAGPVFADPTRDPVEVFLSLPPERDPGTVFAYNQAATYTVAAIVQRVTGETLTAYLRPRLFDPLGVGPVGWLADDRGRELGFSGLHASADAVARLGQLYLDRGTWRGRRLLPGSWVADATRSDVATDARPNPDWQQGYGYQFWMSRHGYRGDGAFGQFCIVLPGQDAVVAVTGASPDMQAVLDAVWTHLLPAFGTASGGAHDGALAERLAALTLPTPAGSPAGDDDLTFTPSDGRCRMQPSLTSIRVHPRGGVPHLDLVEGDHVLRVPLTHGRWEVGTEPVAAAGAWTDPDTLRVEVRFLETPHTLVLTASRSTGTFRARWPTIPLDRLPLRDMRCPT